MNKLINKILKESEESMYDDLFFQPKTKMRDEEEKKKREEEERKWKKILSKMRLGLKNIRAAYENKDWNSEEEKLFLQIFFKLHLSERYSERWNGYLLEDERDIGKCIFDLKYDIFWISRNIIWKDFKEEIHWEYDETQQFMKDMLKKYFKLYEFTPMRVFG